jgi:hypothetical protein
MNLTKLLLTLSVNIFNLFPQEIQTHIYEWANLDKNELTFNVLPNSVWIGYEIKNETRINELLPDDLELSPIKLFSFSNEKKMLFFNFFQVESEYFEGHRLEIVTTVMEKNTKKKRFIILDYYSDTISSDPKNIFKKPNSKHMILSENQNQIVGQFDDKYNFIVEKTNHSMSLSNQFAIGCNKKIYYGTPEIHFPNILNFNETRIKKINIIHKLNIYNQLWEDVRNSEYNIAFYYPQNIEFKIFSKINMIINECQYETNDSMYESFLFDNFS